MLPGARSAAAPDRAPAATSSPTSASTPGDTSAGPMAGRTELVRLTPGVDVETFRPDVDASAVRAPVRAGGAAGDRLRLAAGAAQGAGPADRRAAGDPARRARRRAAARRRRPVPRRPASGGRATHGRGRRRRVHRRRGARTTCRRTTRPATSSRCRAAPAARGLDVEGLGIVYLEASATGLPVLAGDSGGAPDAVLEGETGYVVDGRDVDAVAERLVTLLQRPGAAAPARRGRPGLGRARLAVGPARRPAARAARRLTARLSRPSRHVSAVSRSLRLPGVEGGDLGPRTPGRTTLRLSLSDGVICPPSSVQSSARIANLRIASALLTALLRVVDRLLDLGAQVLVVDEVGDAVSVGLARLLEPLRAAPPGRW